MPTLPTLPFLPSLTALPTLPPSPPFSTLPSLPTRDQRESHFRRETGKERKKNSLTFKWEMDQIFPSHFPLTGLYGAVLLWQYSAVLL